jgi:hypothetical protein
MNSELPFAYAGHRLGAGILYPPAVTGIGHLAFATSPKET